MAPKSGRCLKQRQGLQVPSLRNKGLHSAEAIQSRALPKIGKLGDPLTCHLPKVSYCPHNKLQLQTHLYSGLQIMPPGLLLGRLLSSPHPNTPMPSTPRPQAALCLDGCPSNVHMARSSPSHSGQKRGLSWPPSSSPCFPASHSYILLCPTQSIRSRTAEALPVLFITLSAGVEWYWIMQARTHPHAACKNLVLLRYPPFQSQEVDA